MKKQLALATAALMALSLAACGSTATASSAAESTSTAASSEAASTDSTAADDGDVLQQAAAAAFANDVTLTMWGAEEDQELLRTIADNFIKEYGNYGGKITINLGAQSEKEAKDTVLTDPTAAADVYAFADDQLNELVQAGALQEVQLNADDIKSRNTAASVDAATLNGKLYAYPLTADNGYFMFYDKSFFTEDDVKSLDTMMEKAAAAGKKVSMDVANGWYLYSFYAGAGLNLSLADDGVNTVCNWNEAPGADVTQAILDITANPGFKSGTDADIVSAIKDGSSGGGVHRAIRCGQGQGAVPVVHIDALGSFDPGIVGGVVISHREGAVLHQVDVAAQPATCVLLGQLRSQRKLPQPVRCRCGRTLPRTPAPPRQRCPRRCRPLRPCPAFYRRGCA